jgi:hypothetical protein
MVNFLHGVAAMACAVSGLFFLRFWRQSRDGIFLSFAVAFWVFAVDYAVLGLVPLANERRPYVFGLRLVGFGVILWGIARKNGFPRRRG